MKALFNGRNVPYATLFGLVIVINVTFKKNSVIRGGDLYWWRKPGNPFCSSEILIKRLKIPKG